MPLQLIVFATFIIAAPFLKSALVRRGVAPRLAYACGFGLLVLGVLIVRSARSL